MGHQLAQGDGNLRIIRIPHLVAQHLAQLVVQGYALLVHQLQKADAGHHLGDAAHLKRRIGRHLRPSGTGLPIGIDIGYAPVLKNRHRSAQRAVFLKHAGQLLLHGALRARNRARQRKAQKQQQAPDPSVQGAHLPLAGIPGFYYSPRTRRRQV